MMQENVARHQIFRIGTAIVTLMVLVGIIGTSLLVTARTAAPTINVTINNNSQRDIRHVYVAAGDPNNWSADQLHGSSIPAGSSYTISVSCDGASIRVISEDQDGCFFYRTVSCGENATWTITSDTPRDCGS